MSAVLPSAPRRGPRRSSHLRQASHETPEIVNTSRPTTSASETGTIQHDPIPPKVIVERRCVLWVHDEGFSKDDVFLNLDLFPDVKPGDLMAIVALKTDSGVRDFHDKSQGSGNENDNLGTPMQFQRSNSIPRSLQGNGNELKHDTDLGKRYLFIAKDMSKEMKTKQSNLEVSIAKKIADVFGLKQRSNVLLATADPEVSSASHVELSFRDEYLARSDMWRLALGELCNRTIFKSQKILFMGTIKAQVTAVYVNGRKVQSAFCSTDTKPIFRSESARFVIFIQMSKEMWDFDSEGSGEIMFNKAVNGFLPALFRKWASIQAKHLVSIVLFTRMEYDTGIASELATSSHDNTFHTGTQTYANKKPYKDFYRVVVSEMASGSWTTILYQLKREFKFFRRDISMHRIDVVNTTLPPLGDGAPRGLGTRIEAEPSLAMHGNMLEAINLASSQFSYDYIDRDLMRTGISIVVITPCAGLFEVDYETLRMTTETLIGNGIGIDLVCLPRMPLHSVPLFRYKNPQYGFFQETLHLKSIRSQDSTPRQYPVIFGSSFSSLSDSISPGKALQPDRNHQTSSFAATDPPSEWSYAIPHWIDVSFWTGASQDVYLTKPSTKTAHADLKRLTEQRRSEFSVQCKMYEMEMAAMMENVLSEISVLPLQQDPLFPQMSVGSGIVPGKPMGRETTHNTVKKRKKSTGLLEFMGGPSKTLLDRNSSQQEKTFYKALEKFDHIRSEVFNEPPVVRFSRQSRRHYKSGGEETARRMPAEDSKLLSTSFIEGSESQNSLNPILSFASGRGKEETRSSEILPRTRKNSASNNVYASSQVSPIRPTKLHRQISLGKHGFGIAAPKIATAEIQIEHASAAKPSSATAKGLDKNTSNNPMTSHHLNSAASQGEDRPSSSQSEISKLRPDTSSGDFHSTLELAAGEKVASRPMTIKSALQSLDQTNQFKSRSVLGSVYEVADRQVDTHSLHALHPVRPDDNQRIYNSKLLAEAIPELPTTLSPTTALAPWLSVLNPSNPSANDVNGPSQYRRWQHVFPRPGFNKTMKWKSLCSPASIPITTEFFPTKHQLETEYQQKPYNISQNAEDELSEAPHTRDDFLRELIGLRLSHGFQIVVGSLVAEAFGQKSMKIANVYDQDGIAEDGASVFMSIGNTIHQLSCVNETEIEVNMFVRKPTASTTSSMGPVEPTAYNPAIRTTLAEKYESRKVVLGKQKDEYNWNYVDTFIAGFDEEMSEHLRFWRARFVLIPVERPTQSQRYLGEDNEEETRLEGIKKLTQMWQRHRILSSSERRFQTLASQKTKDPNPLDIVYKTEDPSIVVTAELETLPLVETGEAGIRRGQLLENERFRKSKLDMAALAEAIQAPAERGGVRVQNRRWHFRLHYNCFIGSDMTTWLLDNFEDIETREEAVELGNIFMVKDEQQKLREKDVLKESGKEKENDFGIFVHVEKRHPFRDGQYFYQMAGEFAKQRPESRSGWFGSRRRDASVPSTPMSETVSRDSPRPERSRSSSHNEDRDSDSGTATPTTLGGGNKKPKVALSKVMKYDVDHRKRSYRPERINLHYDRLHNPDNCYHVRIDWMSVTAKLIEDAIASWAATAERYGLRLVEAPIGEACSITSNHPFRSPYIIELAAQPPDQQPTSYFDVNSFTPQVQASPASRHYYQKAIMKRFNFVLDIEAARNFPSNVDVSYSWGKPDFKYTQYIHRSGILLAQITDEGNFLLLANRLYNSRNASARESERYAKVEHADRTTRIGSAVYGLVSDKPTPVNSPALRPTNTTSISSPLLKATPEVFPPGASRSVSNATPDSIKNELEEFCRNSLLLESFYKEVFEKATPPSATPPVLAGLRSPHVGSFLDTNIPTLGLPPGLLARDSSPGPIRLSNMNGVASSMPQLGRRPSVQVGLGWVCETAGLSSRQMIESSREGIGDNDRN